MRFSMAVSILSCLVGRSTASDRTRTILSIDDTRHYYPLMIAARECGIPFYAFQHGRFNPFMPGWAQYSIRSDPHDPFYRRYAPLLSPHDCGPRMRNSLLCVSAWPFQSFHAWLGAVQHQIGPARSFL